MKVVMKTLLLGEGPAASLSHISHEQSGVIQGGLTQIYLEMFCLELMLE